MQEGWCESSFHNSLVALIVNVVFHLQENFLPKQTKLLKKTASDENNSNDLNLTGSPLRDTCDIDYINDSMDSLLGWNYLWTEEDETYRPISIIRAQYV